MKHYVLILMSLFVGTHTFAGDDSTAPTINALTQSENFSSVPIGDGWIKRYGGSTLGPVSIPADAEFVFVTLSNGVSAMFPANASSHQFGSSNYYYGGKSEDCFGYVALGGKYSSRRVYGMRWYSTKRCGSDNNKYQVKYGATINVTSVYYR